MCSFRVSNEQYWNYIFSMLILYPNVCNTFENVLKFILSAFLVLIFCIIVGDTPAFFANFLTERFSDSIFSSTNSDKRNSLYSFSNFAFLLRLLLINLSNVLSIIFFQYPPFFLPKQEIYPENHLLIHKKSHKRHFAVFVIIPFQGKFFS